MTRVRRGRRKPVEPVIPKAALAREIGRLLKRNELTQTEAARLILEAPSQVSLIVNGRLRGFSAERLIRVLTRLGCDVDVVIQATGRGKVGKVRLHIA